MHRAFLFVLHCRCSKQWLVYCLSVQEAIITYNDYCLTWYMVFFGIIHYGRQPRCCWVRKMSRALWHTHLYDILRNERPHYDGDFDLIPMVMTWICWLTFGDWFHVVLVTLHMRSSIEICFLVSLLISIYRCWIDVCGGSQCTVNRSAQCTIRLALLHSAHCV